MSLLLCLRDLWLVQCELWLVTIISWLVKYGLFRGVYKRWTGLMDWNTGLTFDLIITHAHQCDFKSSVN